MKYINAQLIDKIAKKKKEGKGKKMERSNKNKGNVFRGLLIHDKYISNFE